jgi:hypothetical protein
MSTTSVTSLPHHKPKRPLAVHEGAFVRSFDLWNLLYPPRLAVGHHGQWPETWLRNRLEE